MDVCITCMCVHVCTYVCACVCELEKGELIVGKRCEDTSLESHWFQCLQVISGICNHYIALSCTNIAVLTAIVVPSQQIQIRSSILD